MAYEVHLEMFEGPLDLLLFLIKKDDLDIYNIPISRITSEYLAYLDILKDMNLDLAGEFLVLAATLMAIKARTLLPSQEVEGDEGPDPRAELVAKLLEYQKFKQAAAFLEKRADEFKDIYYRGAPHFDDSEKTLGINMFDLMGALREVLDRATDVDKKEVRGEEYPIEEKIKKILDMLETRAYITWDELFKDERKRKSIISCFLALLELTKLQRIFIRQEGNFAKITVYRKEVTADAPVQTPPLENSELKKALESLLFITDHALSLNDLCKITGVKDAPRIQALVDELKLKLDSEDSAVQLLEVADGYQMATRPSYAPFVRKLFAERMTMRLSTAAHETLSIVAYKQPITRAEIEEVRGVEVIAALETLLEKRLLRVVGRKESVGRPLLYGTTPDFLRHFGLKNLEDLPPLETFVAQLAAEAEKAQAATAPDAATEMPAPAEGAVEAGEIVDKIEKVEELRAAAEEAEKSKGIWADEEKPPEDPSSGQ